MHIHNICFCFEAVPTPAISQRRSVTQTTPWPTTSKNSSTLNTRLIRLLYAVRESDGEVASNTSNPRRSLNRRATQAQTQESDGFARTTQENRQLPRPKCEPKGNSGKSPKDRHPCRKRPRRTQNRTNQKDLQKNPKSWQPDLKCSLP